MGSPFVLKFRREPHETVVFGTIVVIRILLSFSIKFEIDDVLPWKRGFLKNGCQLLTEAIGQELGEDPQTERS